MWICILVWGKMLSKTLLMNVVQLSQQGLGYFRNMWNWIDLMVMTTSTLFVFGNLTDFISMDAVNVIGSIAVAMFFVKLVFYIRVFEDYAIFIRMVIDMISAKEMLQFWLMLMVCLAGFSFIIITLNFNRGDNSDTAPIFDDFVGVTFVDAIIHAWLTGLGDFNMDGYSEKNAPMMWLYFIGATIIVQLVFMNLLIAIMSEQYTRLNEMKD